MKHYSHHPAFLKITLIFIAFFYFSVNCYAQYVENSPSYIIKIDSVCRQGDKSFPFDQPFSMILTPRTPQNIVDVGVYIVPNSNNPDTSKMQWVSGITHRLMGSQFVIDVPSLKANKHFDFCLYRKLDSLNFDKFLAYANYIAKVRIFAATFHPTPDEVHAKENTYNDFISGLEGTPYPYPGITSFAYDYLFQSNCLTFQDGQIPPCGNRSLDQLFSPVIDGAYGNILNIAANTPPYAPAVAPAVGQSVQAADFDIVIQQLDGKKLSDFSMNKLLRICSAANGLDNLTKGLIPLNFNYQSQPANPEDIKPRLQNLQTSFKQLSGLLDTVERLNIEVHPAIASIGVVSAYLRNLVAAINTNLQTVTTNYATIKTTFQVNPQLNYTEWYVKNTNSFADLQTESGSIFSPELGLSFLGTSKNNGTFDVIPKLAIGVNINFKSINKSLIVRNILPANRDWRNYISGFVGLTFGGFKDTEYSNLFASNSLLFGLNCRVTRSFYISLGSSVFQQQYKNPVIDDYHTQFGGYVSLMLDIDITNAASNITSILFK